MRFVGTLVFVFCLALSGMTLSGERKQGEWVIALSNAYYGNTWRKQMVDAFTVAAEKAKADGLIKDYIIMNGDGTQNQQIAQMNSLILQGVDFICINAASPTAINGAIEKAHKAGIKTMAFDSIATSPYCWVLEYDNVSYGEMSVEFVAKQLNGKGNVIQVRGASGSAPDLQISEGQNNILAKYPDLKVVATVQGEVSTAVTQKAISNILPSLPEVDAVITQGGGDAFGAAQAFAASGRKLPIIIGDNTAEFINWWLGEKDKIGYETMGVSSAPTCGAASFWLAVNILQGVELPRLMSLPLLVVDQSNVDQFKGLKPGTVASPDFTNEFVKETIIEPLMKK